MHHLDAARSHVQRDISVPGVWNREYVGAWHPVWRRVMNDDELFICYVPPQTFPVPVPKPFRKECREIQRLAMGFPVQRKALEPLVPAKVRFAVDG